MPVKEEPSMNGCGPHRSGPLPPLSPGSPLSPSSPHPRLTVQPGQQAVFHSGSSSPTAYPPVAAFLPHQHQHNTALEKEFQRFRLDCPPPAPQQFQDSGGSLVVNNPTTPNTGKLRDGSTSHIICRLLQI